MATYQKGRPAIWGKLATARPRIPIEIITEIDTIRSHFEKPEDAIQYILEALSQTCRLKFYDAKISATPGITVFSESDSYEEREVPQFFVKKSVESFLARVSGDSMIDAGIKDGDIILAEAINPLFQSPPNRAIVTAVTENNQLVVKRYRYRNKRHELLSENREESYPPILISWEMSEHESAYVFGIFKRVIPKSMIS